MPPSQLSKARTSTKRGLSNQGKALNEQDQGRGSPDHSQTDEQNEEDFTPLESPCLPGSQLCRILMRNSKSERSMEGLFPGGDESPVFNLLVILYRHMAREGSSFVRRHV